MRTLKKLLLPFLIIILLVWGTSSISEETKSTNDFSIAFTQFVNLSNVKGYNFLKNNIPELIHNSMTAKCDFDFVNMETSFNEQNQLKVYSDEDKEIDDKLFVYSKNIGADIIIYGKYNIINETEIKLTINIYNSQLNKTVFTKEYHSNYSAIFLETLEELSFKLLAEIWKIKDYLQENKIMLYYDEKNNILQLMNNAGLNISSIKEYGKNGKMVVVISNKTEVDHKKMLEIESKDDSFVMGDKDFNVNKEQTFSHNLMVSAYEISNAWFKEFVNADGYNREKFWTGAGWEFITQNGITKPLYWENENFNLDDQPVVGISYFEAVAFCNWLSDKSGLQMAYNKSGFALITSDGYRLPTEAEWEYVASKGGAAEEERIYPFGNDFSSKYVVSYADAKETARIGSKSPSGNTPQGISDLSGNVNEWCSDNFRQSSQIDERKNRYYFIDETREFVIRGGAWTNMEEEYFRCAFRLSFLPTERFDNVGFRIVRPVIESQEE